MNDESNGNDELNIKLSWKSALVIVCVGVLGYQILYSNNSVSSIAFLLGRYIVYALITWGLFHYVIGRKRGEQIGWVAFVSIYAAFVIGAGISANNKLNSDREAMASLKPQIMRRANSSTQSTENISIPPGSEASGDVGKMQKLIVDYTNDILAIRASYQNELGSLGWDTIFDFEKLRNDSDVSERRKVARRALAIVPRYKRQMSDLFEQFPARVRALDVSEANKAAIIGGFKKTSVASLAQLDKYWSLEQDIMTNAGYIFDLLSKHKTWEISDGDIAFNNDHDLELFNVYIRAVQSSYSEEEKLRSTGEEKLDKAFDAFDK